MLLRNEAIEFQVCPFLVVYTKPPLGGAEHVLHYLARYTHRVAISNHRLVSFADGKVTFRWCDSAHNNEQKLMTLSIDEFLRRFLLHLLRRLNARGSALTKLLEQERLLSSWLRFSGGCEHSRTHGKAVPAHPA